MQLSICMWECRDMRATVSDVAHFSEGDKTVLRFVLGLEHGRVVPVEMRGDELRGVLRDGDQIDVPELQSLDEGGWAPKQVYNATTRSTVTAWRAPLTRRAGKWLAGGLIGGVLSALGTLLVTYLLAGNSVSASRSDAEGPSGEVVVALLFAGVAGIALVFNLIEAKVRAPERRPTAARIARVSGAFIGALVVAVAFSIGS